MDKKYKNFIEAVLKSSGKVALRSFKKPLKSYSKADGSLVTEVDKEIEVFIRYKIQKNFPEDSIFGEEFEELVTKSEFTWVIDPIDGTSSYASGKPSFGIMLALVKNFGIKSQEAILSGIYQPFTDELWLGDNNRTTLNGKIQKSSNKRANQKLNIATTSPDLLNTKGKKQWLDLKKKANNVTYGGDCYNYCLLASGFIDVVFEQDLKPYDYLPLMPILNGSGAKTDLKIKKNGNADILAKG